MDAEGRNQFEVEIDEQRFAVEDPVITGRQLLNVAGKKPPEEHLIYFLGSGNLLEDIGLDETLDLRQPGREKFITFKADRSFRFELDSKRQDWGAPKISETTLRKLAGVSEKYRVWEEGQGKADDRMLEKGEMVDLTMPGVERFYTGIPNTDAGAEVFLLPQADKRYLTDHGLAFREVVVGPKKGIVFLSYPLPAGFYDKDACDVLVILPGSYPDAAPDMFFTDPWVKLRAAGRYAQAADQAFDFDGRRWQRWSRHNRDWRPGVDGIHTMLRRIELALRSAN